MLLMMHQLHDHQAWQLIRCNPFIQVYTWPDASLRELTDLVKEVQPAARRSTARLDFALVYPDKRGRNVMRVVRAPGFAAAHAHHRQQPECMRGASCAAWAPAWAADEGVCPQSCRVAGLLARE